MPSLRSLSSRTAAVGAAVSSWANARALTTPIGTLRSERSWSSVLFSCVLLCWIGLFVAPLSAKTAMQTYVEAMQPGWNLGNSLDATPTETSWGNPVVTQAFIQQIKAQGFKSIRIPVTWEPYMGAGPSYTIDEAWLNHVQQVVDWSLDAGLYVMLNVHHDSYWIRAMPTKHDEVLARFNAIWSQLAPRFRDYPDKLMLESINEPAFDGVDDATKMSLLNELNTSFFHIVRGTGGGNATRPLVLPSVETNSGLPFLASLRDTMRALNDSNLIATVHYYGFWPFSVNISGVTSVTDSVVGDINAMANNCHTMFVSEGIPVVVGELGILSYNPNNQVIERGEMLKYFELVTAAMRTKGITWQLWDAGGQFNRYTNQWGDPELFNYYMQSLVTRSSTGATDLIFVKNSESEKDVVIPLNLNGNTFVSLSNGADTLVPGMDYLLNGSTLTIKASALAPYASGDYGEKAVFTANFSAGQPWKLRVRYCSAPALGTVSGTKAGGDLVIPAAFNGDLVATMEAKYVAAPGYPYPGQAEWTSFKQYADSFQPDYTNNTFTVKKAFFDKTNNNAVDLILHFWSGRTVNYRLSFEADSGTGVGGQEWSVYQEGLSAWNNWGSWAGNNPDNTAVVHSGAKSISVDAGAWGALVLQYNSWEPPVDTSIFHTLVFWIHGGTLGGQNLGVRIVRGDDWSSPGINIPAPAANTWRQVEIPLSAFGVEGSSNITRVVFQNWTGAAAPTFYVDDIKLSSAFPSDVVFVNGAPAPVISSASSAAGVINSPFIYSISALNTPTLFSASGLPDGLSLDSATGVISGTPSVVGTFSVTVAAANDYGSDSTVLRLTIAGLSYSDWALAKGLEALGNQPAADPDGDGVPNQLEYLLGLDPRSPDSDGLPTCALEGDNFVYRFVHNKSAAAPFLLEQSADLRTWSALSWSLESSTVTTETLVAQLPSSGLRGFVRLSSASVSTIPLGYMSVSLDAAKTSAFSVLLDDCTARPIGLRACRIESVNTNTLSNGNGGWAGDLADPAAPWAVRFTSGAAAGRLLDVSANTATSISLGAVNLVGLGIMAGDSFELVALDTLASLFGSSMLKGGATAATADVVQLRSGSTWVSYYYDTTLGYWRCNGTLINGNNAVIRPGSGLLVLRRGTSLPLIFTGRVLAGKFRFSVNNAGSTALSLGFPTDSTLADFAAQTLLSGWRSGTSTSVADAIGLFNGRSWTPYVFNGVHWQTTNGIISDSLRIPAGSVIIIQRPGAKAGTTELLRNRTF